MQFHSLDILLRTGTPTDAPILHEMLRRESPSSDVRIDSVQRLSEVIEALTRSNYDCLLIDAGEIEEKDWKSFTDISGCTPLPPIIALLPPGDGQAELAAVRCNAQDVLRKGRFDGALLVRVILHAMEKCGLQRALRDSEERWRLLFEQSPEAIVLVDPETMAPVEFNDAACGILGYSREEMAKMRMDEHETIHPGELLRMKDLTPGQRQAFETFFRDRNGEIRDIAVVVQVAALSGRRLLHIVFRDVTRKKSAERGIKLLATAVEQTVEGILIIGKDGLIQYANPSYRQISGHDPGELVGCVPSRVFESKPQCGTYKDMQETVCGGRVWRGRFQSRKKNGETYDTETTISSVRGEDGEITHYVAIERDISREIDLERQLRQAQKMEAIGVLAGGIAHDFNNILGIIMGYTDMLAMVASKNGMPAAELKQITKATHRAKDLIRQILSFSRKGEQKRMPLQLGIVVKEALKMLRASLPSTIEIIENIESESVISADPTQVHQVLMNLCTNAFHAMRERGGELAVNLEDVEIDLDSHHPDLPPGSYVRLAVSDTGCGISPEIMERIFEPFFTTKKVGDGTGMGLSVVHGIVKSYRGAIIVRSAPGQGSIFNVFIPRVETHAAAEQEKPKKLPRGAERILFVDDEEELARLSARMLEPLGYKLDIRTNSVEAMEIFQREPWRFDLVITDQTMPHLTGAELAKQMLDIRSDMPIILCSGFSEALTPEKITACGVRKFILKPLSLSLLARTIREVLDNGGRIAPPL